MKINLDRDVHSWIITKGGHYLITYHGTYANASAFAANRYGVGCIVTRAND